MQYRIGHGIDVHQLVNNIPLIIGGIHIPYHKGSKGHSDGDVLFHAIVDSMLGALALGDIGKYFPSNNTKWKNANSKIFIDHIYNLINEKKYFIINIDTTIILQEPILSPYISEIKNNICSILSVKRDQISVKATTTDGLGFIGKNEGISATATILLSK